MEVRNIPTSGDFYEESISISGYAISVEMIINRVSYFYKAISEMVRRLISFLK